jgi:hypothetical protein
MPTRQSASIASNTALNAPFSFPSQRPGSRKRSSKKRQRQRQQKNLASNQTNSNVASRQRRTAGKRARPTPGSTARHPKHISSIRARQSLLVSMSRMTLVITIRGSSAATGVDSLLFSSLHVMTTKVPSVVPPTSRLNVTSSNVF